jgi:hypothetical protein
VENASSRAESNAYLEQNSGLRLDGSTALARAWRLQGLLGRSRRRLCFETRSSTSTLSRHRVTAPNCCLSMFGRHWSFVHASTELRISRVESSCGAHCLGTPKCCATHAARRCSCMQVLECSALQSIDDHHTKETVCLLPTACLLHTHTHPWAARCPPPACLPCPAPPTLYLGRPNRRISVEPCPLRAYPRRGAWSRRPSFTPSARNTLILRHCCTRASGTLLKQTPPLRLLPALAPNRLAVAGSLLWSAPSVACQPCLMALGGAAEWTASRSPSCTLPLQ